MTQAKGIAWTPLAFVLAMHFGTIYGLVNYGINWNGFCYMTLMYALTGLGITVGYHRLWSHRSYKAIFPYRVWWAFWGAGAMQGSILWWSRLHRLHHSFPDTPADPYGPAKGFWYSHCLWMFEDVDRSKYMSRINVQDLKEDKVVMKQHKWYVGLSFFVAFGVPLLLASDKLQALFFGGFAARCLTWHSTWCVNSLAHWLGSDEYSNETSAKDHFFTALMTLGEGNHGFHHAFAFSYKNGIRWYDYDPTKLLIELSYFLGLAYDLKHPPENEIQKARFQVQEGKLTSLKQSIAWPDPEAVTNEITMEQYKNAKKEGQIWVAYKGGVYDVTAFTKEHPGGEKLLRGMGSAPPEYIEEQFMSRHMHSKAARNMLDMMIIGRLAPQQG